MSEERLYPGDWVEDLNGRKGHVQFTDLAACCVTVAWTGEHSGWVQSDLLTRIGPSVRLAATQSVVEDLEGALRRIAEPHRAVTGGDSTPCPSCIAHAALKAASLPSPEPTRCPKCGEIVTPSASPGITHMCDPYQAATYVTESKMGFNAEPTQQEDEPTCRRCGHSWDEHSTHCHHAGCFCAPEPTQPVRD